MKGDYMVNINMIELFIMQRMILPDPELEDRHQNHVSDEYIRGINDAIIAMEITGTEMKEEDGGC